VVSRVPSHGAPMLNGLIPLARNGTEVSDSQNFIAALQDIASNWSAQLSLNHF